MKFEERFRRCDQRLIPEIDKVLNRLPEDIKERVLNDEELQFRMGADALGEYIPFEKSIRNLIIFNTNLAEEDEVNIIHTIVHEIAHYITYEANGINEMLAEDKIIEWGFQEESEKGDYANPQNQGYAYNEGAIKGIMTVIEEQQGGEKKHG